jgi:hypothetical protein
MTQHLKNLLFTVITIVNVVIYLGVINQIDLLKGWRFNFRPVDVRNYTRRERYLREHNTNDTNAKYIQYECAYTCLSESQCKDECGGWADRLKGILSTYAWAQITNRKFRIRITHPCPLDNMLTPNLVNWNASLTRNGKPLRFEDNSTRSVHLYSVNDNNYVETLKLIDLFQLESDKDLISITANRDWFQSFIVNPSTSRDMFELGYNSQSKLVSHVRQWYFELFKLAPTLQARYNLLLAQIEPKIRLICAQIRIGGKRPHVDNDLEFNQLSSAKYFWKFIRDNFINGSSDYKLFLTTDREEVFQEAVREFGQERLLTFYGLYTHIGKDVSSDSCERVEKTILDFQFMQNCDQIVVSHSGYGKFGNFLRPNASRSAYFFSRDMTFLPFDYNIIIH